MSAPGHSHPGAERVNYTTKYTPSLGPSWRRGAAPQPYPRRTGTTALAPRTSGLGGSAGPPTGHPTTRGRWLARAAVGTRNSAQRRDLDLSQQRVSDSDQRHDPDSDWRRDSDSDQQRDLNLDWQRDPNSHRPRSPDSHRRRDSPITPTPHGARAGPRHGHLGAACCGGTWRTRTVLYCAINADGQGPEPKPPRRAAWWWKQTNEQNNLVY